jgi:hypothetical protein
MRSFMSNERVYSIFRHVIRLVVLAAACLNFSLGTGWFTTAMAEAATQDKWIAFDIPAQPLADALIAYSAATGIEVYYNGAFAIDRRSAPVVGKFTPRLGLAALLRRAGVVPRATGIDSFILEPASPTTTLPARVPDTLIQQYRPYFAAIQTQVIKALCHLDASETHESIFSFWVAATGVIVRAEPLTSSGDPAHDVTISAALQGLRLDEPPPSGLPQPVTMAIYPPSAGETPGCSAPQTAGP